MRITVEGRKLHIIGKENKTLTKKNKSCTIDGTVVCKARSLAFYLPLYIILLLALIPILWFVAPVSLLIFFFLGHFYNPFDLKFDSAYVVNGSGDILFDYKYDYKASKNINVTVKYPVYLFFIRYVFNFTGLALILGLLLKYYFIDYNAIVLALSIVYGVIAFIVLLFYTLTLVKRYKIYRSLDGKSYEAYLEELAKEKELAEKLTNEPNSEEVKVQAEGEEKKE